MLYFDRADDVSILDYLVSALNEFDGTTPVNNLCENFKKIVKHCTERYVPVRHVRKKKHNPWITREILQLIGKIKLRRRKKTINRKE